MVLTLEELDRAIDAKTRRSIKQLNDLIEQCQDDEEREDLIRAMDVLMNRHGCINRHQ